MNTYGSTTCKFLYPFIWRWVIVPFLICIYGGNTKQTNALMSCSKRVVLIYAYVLAVISLSLYKLRKRSILHVI